jgi:signal transduction histidine kinase
MESAENLLASMEDLLLWSKGQMENFKPHPKKTSIEKLFSELKTNFSGKENITFDFEDPEEINLITDKNYLKTMMRNLTSNAIKALENTSNAKITWKAWTENGKNLLSIIDNGPGGTDEKFRALYDENVTVGIKTGLGLHLVRDMGTAIGCSVKVNTAVGKGTEITLCFINAGL